MQSSGAAATGRWGRDSDCEHQRHPGGVQPGLSANFSTSDVSVALCPSALCGSLAGCHYLKIDMTPTNTTLSPAEPRLHFKARLSFDGDRTNSVRAHRSSCPRSDSRQIVQRVELRGGPGCVLEARFTGGAYRCVSPR